ncbi:hypothetical protein SNE40_020804 [Patella caerulea]|uniref:Reverse transcriptase n=1 Tax=Patella caerulea TaxID=87958 RepID=A0AAN8J502_PATCE
MKEYWRLLNSDRKRHDTDSIDIDRFHECFSKLNKAAPINEDTENELLQQSFGDVENELNVSFTEEEITKCIQKLKPNKAYGIDNILNEYIKHTEKSLIQTYVALFNLILETGTIPSEWSTGIIRPLYKNKGARADLDNYRGITILSCLSKLFTAVVNER